MIKDNHHKQTPEIKTLSLKKKKKTLAIFNLSNV